jgi:hydroxymethylpyrimidine/phosphomethylpyrimidine kinase
LTIAGSDSGGGAGIQADLKAFLALGVHGTSVVTCITAQNPATVTSIEACRPNLVRSQLEAVFHGFKPVAAKTGMLYSAEIIRTVSEFLRDRNTSLIVDPVMISTSGARLLKPAAVKVLVCDLFPVATLVTPNIPEADFLLNGTIRSIEDMDSAAQEIYRRFGCAVLLKGGHLEGARSATDLFFDGKRTRFLESPFINGIQTHGTGCTYSAAITALLARGVPLARAVADAKKYITEAIRRTRMAGKYFTLGFPLPFPSRRGLGGPSERVESRSSTRTSTRTI